MNQEPFEIKREPKRTNLSVEDLLSQEETRNIKIIQTIERRIADKKKKFEEFNKNAHKNRGDSEDTKDLIVSTNHMKLAHDEA